MKLDTKKVINYWIENAEYKWDTAKALKRSKRYSDCLFFCHLVLECLLKALVVRKTNKTAPYIHDLERLAGLGGVAVNDQQREVLVAANSFNIRARYADYKLEFYKRCTKEYGEEYFDKCNKSRLWLLKELQNNKLKSM